MLKLAPSAEVERAWTGPAAEPASAECVIDGLPYRAERGAGDDHLIHWGPRARFHVSPDHRVVLCAPADSQEPGWRRVLLDSVLGTVSLLHGFEVLHASAVLCPGGVIALIGPTGGGKTTLACELVGRGLPLFCDDLLALGRDEHDQVLAHPGPPVMNVPAGREPQGSAALASFGDEHWVAMPGAAAEPAPLAAVFLLDRRTGLRGRVVSGSATVLDILAHALDSGRGAERRRSQFELVSDVAGSVLCHRLEADPRTSPGELADLVESALPAIPATTAPAA